ncbi:MAG: chemotaxis protein [Candidatus Xenobiia bacterium LiM19]
MDRQGILLESGTNEVEIMEFLLREQRFGINVAKVRQIIQFDSGKLSALPNSKPAAMGVYLHRNQTIPLIDLGKILDIKGAYNTVKPLVMICEFNTKVYGFYVDGVKRIHRVSWSQIQPMSDILGQKNTFIISTITLENHEVLIADLEYIISTLDPDSDSIFNTDEVIEEVKDKEKSLRLIIVEDSGFIRNKILKSLTSSGFEHVEAFSDGRQAFDAISAYVEQSKTEKKSLSDFFEIIITDIEMPKMDGLTLCKLLREELNLRDTKIIIYSSLINDEMARKCKTVGADSYVSKPKITDLVNIIHDMMK